MESTREGWKRDQEMLFIADNLYYDAWQSFIKNPFSHTCAFEVLCTGRKFGVSHKRLFYAISIVRAWARATSAEKEIYKKDCIKCCLGNVAGNCIVHRKTGCVRPQPLDNKVLTFKTKFDH